MCGLVWYPHSLNDVHHQSLILEGDNQIVINHIKGTAQDYYDAKPILKDILGFMEFFSKFFARCVSRQANQAEGFLAAHARKGDFNFSKDMDIAFQLAAVLWRDTMGIGAI